MTKSTCNPNDGNKYIAKTFNSCGRKIYEETFSEVKRMYSTTFDRLRNQFAGWCYEVEFYVVKPDGTETLIEERRLY